VEMELQSVRESGDIRGIVSRVDQLATHRADRPHIEISVIATHNKNRMNGPTS